MSKVKILLLAEGVTRRVWITKEVCVQVAKEYLNQKRYRLAFEGEFILEGQAAAEEAFDLTNNPGRDKERWMTYGPARSVSSGDIVEVDGKMFLCLSIGWVELEALPC